MEEQFKEQEKREEAKRREELKNKKKAFEAKDFAEIERDAEELRRAPLGGCSHPKTRAPA